MPNRGRPSNPDSPYTMKIHKNGKYRYASTQRIYTNQDGVKTYKHFHWGTLTSDNVFVPNHDFLYLPKSEREKFIFPDDWNFQELSRLQSSVPAPEKKGAISVEPNMLSVYHSRAYGAVWLLEWIGKQHGIREDLMATFAYDQAIVDDIMTVAMYMYITNYNLDRLEEWQALERYPSQRRLNPSAITALQKSITEQHRIDLMKCRADRIKDEAVLAVDSTTKSGFGGKLIDLAWGKNKEGLKLPVTLEVVVYSITDHIPVYYKTFAGNTYDGRSVDIIMADLKEAGFNNFILMMDRAYPSLKNIDRFIQDDVSIIACMKAGTGFSLTRIRQLGEFSFVPKGFVYDEDLDLYTAQYDLKRSVSKEDGTSVCSKDLRLHLYFDPVRRSSILKKLDTGKQKERMLFDALISEGRLFTSEEVELMAEQYDLFQLNWKSVKIPVEACPDYREPEHKRGPKKKYIIKYQLSSYDRDESAMMNAKTAAGFRALITLGMPFTSNEAMNHYRLRGEQEMDNEQWKTLFQCDRERNSSEAAKTGASFIQFVGRIMSCSLRYRWRSNIELRKMFKSSLTILDEMRRIRCVEYPGQSEMRLTPFIGRQLDICRLIGADVPEGCSPD